MSVNRVIITGRLTRDPEIRTTTTGKSVCSVSVAVKNKFAKDNDHFFHVTAWGQAAEFLASYMHKGDMIAVDGRLEQRKYTDKQGNNREVVEIVADVVESLQPKSTRVFDDKDTTVQGMADDEYDPFADE